METLNQELKTFDIGSRLSILKEYWDNNFADVDIILIRNGKDAEGVMKIKTSAVQSWLLRFEFINTIMAIKDKKVVIIGSSDKINTLKNLEQSAADEGFTLEFVVKKKEVAESVSEFLEKVLGGKMKVEGKALKIGCFLKEKQVGKLIEEFNTQIQNHDPEFVEIAPHIQEILCVKQPEDVTLVDKCGSLSVYFFKLLIDEIESIIDEGTKIKHSQLSNKIDEFVTSKRKDYKAKFGIKPIFFDLSYIPIIQSGGKYNLKANAESNKEVLQHDCIILSLGTKYYEFNTNVVRTLFINASREEQSAYKIAYEAHRTLIRNLVKGNEIGGVYKTVREFILGKDPNLENHLTSNFGFGMGLEFRESNLIINAKNHRIVKPNMVFNAVIGFKNMVTASGRQFAIKISDTILVKDDGNSNLSREIEKTYDDIGYTLEDDGEEEPAPVPEKKKILDQVLQDKEKNAISTRARRRRTSSNVLGQTAFIKIKKNQARLLLEKTEELKTRLDEGKFITSKSLKNQVKLQKVTSYRNVQDLPKNIKKNMIHVDMKRDTILLPVFGQIVPYHISVIKNVSRQNEGRITSLRFNFNIPGNSTSSNIVFPDPKTLDYKPIYLKEMTYRSARGDHLNGIYKRVKDLQKAYKQKEILDEVQSNQTISLIHGKKPALQNLKLRPTLSGRKTVGTLECHKNGFRFYSKKHETLDILFNNIKHCFFQPSEGEMIILIHIHTKNPIVVGKKKVQDVQFYTEAGSFSEDVTGMRNRRYSNFNEDEEEQLEKQQREKLDKEFQYFVKVVERFTKEKVKFDVPYRNLGFTGSPYNNNVRLMPTVNCLVHLTHSPFLVVSLDEVEVAFLERVGFHIKNFDLVLIYKDYTKKVVFINAIPVSFKDHIKTWLDSVDILFFESPTNFKWDKLLKRIRSDPEFFVFEEGGWEAFADDEEDVKEEEREENNEDSAFDSQDFNDDDLESESEYTDIEDEEEDSYNEEDELSEEEDDYEGGRRKKLKR